MANTLPSTSWADWLERQEASAYLLAVHGIKLGKDALANLAVKGSGPAYHRDGNKRVVYARADLDAWAPKRIRRVSSTSELRARAGEAA